MNTAIYNFKRFSPVGTSYKNSCTFASNGKIYIAATDMLNGGVVILNQDGTLAAHFFRGWRMMWAPHVIIVDNKTWCFVCDTAGGDTSHWWDFMRIYRFEFDMHTSVHGIPISVKVYEDECGLIDPCPIKIDEWWYLFYAKLWDSADLQWWDPHYSVSKNPFGPYEHEIHFGIGDPDVPLTVDDIDEAPKPFFWGDQLHIWTAHGDSGVNGHAMLSQLVTLGQHPDGWNHYRARPLMEVRAKNARLCTAIEGFPNFTATCREPSANGMISGFYLVRL